MKIFTGSISLFFLILAIYAFYLNRDVAGIALLSSFVLFFVFTFAEELHITSFQLHELKVTLEKAKVSLKQIQDLAYNSAESILLLQKTPKGLIDFNKDLPFLEVLPAKEKKIQEKIFNNLTQLDISQEKIEKLKQEYGE